MTISRMQGLGKSAKIEFRGPITIHFTMGESFAPPIHNTLSDLETVPSAEAPGHTHRAGNRLKPGGRNGR